MNQVGNNIGQASIPTQSSIDQVNADGNRIMNVDGEGVAGGRLIAGLSGYDLGGLQPPGVAKCAAFPLFCMQSLPYTSTSVGWQCSVNAVNLNNERHKW
jgi:hypothetical protein